MAQRITRPFVERQLENLNRMAKMPLAPYQNLGNGLIHNNGCFYIDSAYNGWELSRVGSGPVVRHGHVSLREVSNQIEIYMRGWEDAKAQISAQSA